MVKEGYEKVMSPEYLSHVQVSSYHLDETRSIQDCYFPAMDGTGSGCWTDWGHQDGSRRCPIKAQTGCGGMYRTRQDSHASSFRWITPFHSWISKTLIITVWFVQTWHETSRLLSTKSKMSSFRHWQSSSLWLVAVCDTWKKRHWCLKSSLEWVKVPILPTVRHIICRASSRMFVGTPLCVSPLSTSFTVTYPEALQAEIVITRNYLQILREMF